MAVNIGPKVQLDGWAEFRKDMDDMIQQQKTLKSEMKLVASGFDESTSAQKKARAMSETLSKQVQVQKEQVRLLKEQLEKATKEFGENDTRTEKWRQKLNNATAELNRLNRELSEVKTRSNIFTSAVDKMGKKLKTSLIDGIKTAANSVGPAITGMVAAAGAGVVALGKIGLEYNMEMESYTTNFKTMLGSTEAAVEKVETLKDMAAATPFEMTDLAAGTQQLLAMSVASEDTGQVLQQLGDISLGNVEKFNSLIGAYGKMNSAGKVTLEYINIMAEQGFNPLNLIAQKTGETMAQVYDRVSKGTVTFDEVKEAIATATSQGGQFYKGMEQASKTTQGMISTLKDNATALVGEVFQPISEDLMGTLLPGAIDAVEELGEAFRTEGVNGMLRAGGDIAGSAIAGFTRELPGFADVAVGVVENFLGGLSANQDAIADGAADTILTLADGLIDMAPELIVTGTMLILKVGVGMIGGIPNLIRSIPDMVKDIGRGFIDQAPEFVEIGEDLLLAFLDGLMAGGELIVEWATGWWDEITEDFADWAALFQPGGALNGMTMVGGEVVINGSHATGLRYVPFDGYVAELHKGEMVLPRREAEWLRSQRDFVGVPRVNNYGGFTFHVYAAPGQDAREIAQEVKEILVDEIERREADF